MFKHRLLIALALFVAMPALATTFVVPDDAEMIAKADAIVIGTVEGHYVDTAHGIETVYEIRVARSIKGGARSQELLSVFSPGGELEGYGVYVPGAPHFESGERVLLFLTREQGRWMATDLTLGKFRFTTSTMGANVLVRDAEDIVGWDRSGAPHVEHVRREAGFLRFIEERVAGRKPTADYFVAPSAITLSTRTQEDSIGVQPNAPAFPPRTYTDNIQLNGVYIGTRWSNISAGVTFYKRTETNIGGAADGGASVISNALASWNNECGSVINLIYGGNRSGTPSANQDGISVVEFNDPQGRIGGSWTGSGTVATTFISYYNPHEFPAGTTWWSIRDADVVFQDGYTAGNTGFATAMMHEIGHGIGWRHSNAHYTRPTGSDQPCDPSVEECSSSAIMYYSVIASFGYTLQTWDINAAQAVYPGGSCSTCTAPAITTQPQSQTVNSGQQVTLSVGATGTTPLSYQWYTGTSGNTASPINGATGSSVTVAPTTTTSYWVRVSNACGAVNSNTATLTVNATCTLPAIQTQPRSQAVMPNTQMSLSVSASGTGLTYQWYRGASGATGSPIGGATSPTLTTFFTAPAQSFWVRVSNACGSVNSAAAFITPLQTVARIGGDYDGDGRTDRVVFRPSSSTWYIRYNTGATAAVTFGISTDIPVPADYDGDGRTDIAVFRPSTATWIFRLANGAAKPSVQLGQSTDVPVPADYDGDGDDDIAIWRPSNGLWIIDVNGTQRTVGWGAPTDIPVPADYNGDGHVDVAVWRPSTGAWYIQGMAVIGWGAGGDIPVPGDFNGDGTADRAVFRNGAWYIYYPSGAVFRAFGQTGDVPLPTDINADRRAETTVFRPTNGLWYTTDAATGIVQIGWGTAGDMPLSM